MFPDVEGKCYKTHTVSLQGEQTNPPKMSIYSVKNSQQGGSRAVKRSEHVFVMHCKHKVPNFGTLVQEHGHAVANDEVQ